MPKNKSRTIKERENLSRFSEEAVTLRAEKNGEYPASLNNIPKRES